MPVPALQAPLGWSDLWRGESPMPVAQPGDDELFVLLDDARSDASPRLFRQAHEVVEAWTLTEVVPALERIRQRVDAGFHAAGYLSYEAGFALEPRLARLDVHPVDGPLVWFGIFDAPVTTGAPLPTLDAVTLAETELISCVTHSAYLANVNSILGLIDAGDCYQVNYTIEALLHGAEQVMPQQRLAQLRTAQHAGWGGHVATQCGGVISCSPELFFAMENGRIWTRPMKGTASRDDDAAMDAALRDKLRADPKERAENLMIVDLLRNDLSRVSQPGTVRVEKLFEIETYPTVHQMTSSISAQLLPGLSAVDVIRQLFPCGSITGAPKIRAMEIIAEHEQRGRGAYTGAMGFIAPDGRAAFNVLIRSLEYRLDRSTLRFGVGSGIVRDSNGTSEWQECQSKARFLAEPFR